MGNYLEIFMSVVECGSFSKAAENAYMSSVSIMKQINNLENLIGIKLLNRTNHGVSLTAAGRSFYDDVKALQGYYNKSIEHARKIAAAEQHIIKVGTSILRPCNPLINLWSRIDDSSSTFQFKVIPFEDNAESINSILSSIGDNIDCFVNACAYSEKWLKLINIQIIGMYKCCIAVPHNHRLSKKKLLTWSDLDNENLLLIKHGEVSVIDKIREEIVKNHPEIHIIDLPQFFDPLVFNKCSENNYIMQTLDGWAPLHPNLVTIPMEWSYEIPYGIIYSKKPSKAVTELIKKINSSIV